MVECDVEYEKDNIFAKILRKEIPNFTVYENDNILVMMDIMPMSRGHCLLLPKAPSRNLLDANDEVLGKILPAIKKVAKAVKKAMNADGIIIKQFNEDAAGQTVYHLHFHIIPAYRGEKLARHADRKEDNEILAARAKEIANYIEEID